LAFGALADVSGRRTTISPSDNPETISAVTSVGHSDTDHGVFLCAVIMHDRDFGRARRFRISLGLCNRFRLRSLCLRGRVGGLLLALGGAIAAVRPPCPRTPRAGRSVKRKADIGTVTTS
jgi:hypothetical protein